jgi:protein gp37
MNKTKIETCDYTWNPVTGCWGPGGTAEKPNRCRYCYAEKVARRFYHPLTNRGYFDPTLHLDRLSEPAKVKKPSKIFVCSMADLFGDEVPREWIEAVLNRIQRADYSHHTYQFLTKNPKRLVEAVKRNGPFPGNAWVGTTVTNQADADERLPWLLQVDASVRFVSHEPLLSEIDLRQVICRDGDHLGPSLFNHGEGTGIDWAIIGAMTGPRAVKPEDEWVSGLIHQYLSAGVPVFLKDNLGWPEKIQKWPELEMNHFADTGKKVAP